jgi:hypothetical protein
MAPVLNFHFYENENNIISSDLLEMELWTLVNACLVDNFTALPARNLLLRQRNNRNSFFTLPLFRF